VNPELTADDAALLTALAILERDPGATGSWAPGGPWRAAGAWRDGDAGAAGEPGDRSEAADTLTRLYYEALGLIPSSLPPMAPHPRIKNRILAAIAEAAVPPAANPPAAVPPAAAVPPPLPSAGGGGTIAAPPAFPAPAGGALPEGTKGPEGARESAAAGPAAGVRAGSRLRPWLGLAAVLVLALVGVSGWLYRGLADRDAAMAGLAAEREAALRRVSEAEARLQRSEAQADNLRKSFAVVTSPAVSVCALRPTSQMPAVAGAHGILFVAADHQHWYMSLRGLQPAGAGKVYQLWFVGAQGPVSAGTFSGDPAASWQVGSEHMPPETREVHITIEDGAGSPAPRGPEVLRNADLIRVL
jgi:hypothetical protein